MASRAISINGSVSMAGIGTDTRKILEAISASERTHQVAFNTLNISVAGLQEKVLNIGVQVNALTAEMQTIRDSKASRPELDAAESRLQRGLGDLKLELERDISRLEADVDKDVEAFQSMYESVVQEMKDMRSELGGKLDSLVSSREQQDARNTQFESRLKTIEPLHDVWMQMLGARWIVGLLGGVIGSGAALSVAKFFGWLK